jgi:ornithine cyclodeaminase/alanine dehydrogenase-like protein (mu-crystallin family)
VTELGDVLTGASQGRRDPGDITLFDSTGLAIQDLAIAKVALAKADDMHLTLIDL